MDKIKYHFLHQRVRLRYGLHSKPHYLLRTATNLAKNRLLHRLPLRGVDFALTYACNFNCRHCYAKRLASNRPVMQIEDYRRVCEEAMSLGATVFSLQGGEVFLNPEWKEIIPALQPSKNHMVVTTNGWLATEENVSTLKRLGVDTVYFSIDSGIPGEHDSFRRREGSFAKIMEGIFLCKKHKLKVAILTCLSKFNVRSEGLKRLLDFSRSNRFLLCTILARPLGNWEGNTSSLLSEEDLKYFTQLRKDYPEAFLENENNYGQTGCLAVKEYIYITPYGDVCPCPFTHISLGNVLSESLRIVRERGLKAKWWNHYHKRCLTALDEEFMQLYYPLVEKKHLVSLEEFK